MPDTSTPTPGSTRRTVLRTASWAAPVAVVATAAPSFAQSPATPALTISSAEALEDGTFTVTGTVPPSAGTTTPTTLTVAYDGEITGDTSVAVVDGAFVLEGITRTDGFGGGTVTVSALGYVSATATVEAAPGIPGGSAEGPADGLSDAA